MYFSKTFPALLATALLLGSCGNSGDKSATSKDSSGTALSAADTKGLELIGANDCGTCHRLHADQPGSTIGPAYDQVAAKYTPAADTTVDHLVKKVISGGSGVWGTVPMTPHPAVKPDDIKTMVTYILTLKKSS